MTAAPVEDLLTHPLAPRRSRRAGSRAPAGLVAAGGAVAAVLAMPLVFLLIESAGTGISTIGHLIGRSLTVQLLGNTLVLVAAVTAAATVLGVAAAYAVERTDLPGRRVWSVLFIVPLAIPDFVVSFGWSSLWPAVQGLGGAVLVMALAVYPLVYVPVAASLRGADPEQENLARSLGASRWSTLWRVTIGQARRAILGGALLVALTVLAEYGAIQMLGYQTFTTEIFTEFSIGFDVSSACALSLVLVLVSLLVVLGEARLRGSAGAGTPRPARLARAHPLGRWRIPAALVSLVLVAAALGVPVGSCLYWIAQGGVPTISGVSIGAAAGYTAAYSAAAAFFATLAAIPVAWLALRHRRRLHRILERSTVLVLAVPGLVIALALSYFSERELGGFAYESAPMLVLAYAILFFPLALVGVRASLAQAPAIYDDVARSLGTSRLTAAVRVTLPLVSPGLGAAFCLVFLSAATELSATLLLHPTGVATLATQFWSYQQNLSYAQAAPFALAMIVIAAFPSYLLARYFDRLPARARR